jgi:hypothetical protein
VGPAAIGGTGCPGVPPLAAPPIGITPYEGETEALTDNTPPIDNPVAAAMMSACAFASARAASRAVCPGTLPPKLRARDWAGADAKDTVAHGGGGDGKQEKDGGKSQYHAVLAGFVSGGRLHAGCAVFLRRT